MQTGDPLRVAPSSPGFPPSTYSYPGSLQPHRLAPLSVKTGAFSQSSSGPTAGREGSGLCQTMGDPHQYSSFFQGLVP